VTQRRTSASTLLLAVVLAGGCAGSPQASPAVASTPLQQSWRSRITETDNVRLRDWRKSWTVALAEARTAGFGAAIAAEGTLLDPDAALPLQEPPLGLYRCRTIKIGAKSAGMLNYVPYPPFDCRISRENGVLRFTKLNGSQRPIGVLLPQTDKRMVFLGTLQLGDESNTLDYGRDHDRDAAALLERIGERRWRLAFPSPHFESLMDVMDLVPKADTAPPRR
jgi:uncharacterized protein DUF4893